MIPPISRKFSCDSFLTHADLSIQIKRRLNIRLDGFLNQRSFDVKVKRTTAAKALIGAVFGAAAIFAAPVQAKDWKTVTIALEGGYAPWNLTLPGGKLGGFEPELVANLCERIKLQCNLVAQDWDGMIPGLQAGKFDVLMDAISITPEREKIIAFSKPYAATPATFAVADAKVLPKAAPGSAVVKLSGDPTSRPSTRCASS
jgi:octopine/nopaline transport system substrate-binding protein